jgi:hypothetical protein
MEPEVAAALVTSIASLIVALASGFYTARAQHQVTILKGKIDLEAEERQLKREAEAVLDRYREPLAGAAFDLQSRLWNILDNYFLDEYAKPGNERRVEAVGTTLYRIAQYFAWTEMLRRDIQFLQFSDKPKTKKVAELQVEVADKFNTDGYPGERQLMIWKDAQRAIGELMIQHSDGKTTVLGYAGFLKNYSNFRPWLERVERALQPGLAPKSHRLTDIQHDLVALVKELDKQGRFDSSQLTLAEER